MPDADSTEPAPPRKPAAAELHGLDPRDLFARGLRGVTTSEQWEPPTPEEMSSLLPQYHIECLLGRGGMGAVYKGVQPELERPVAIKILPAEIAADEEFVTRFKREARTLARLQHSRIITIHDYGQTREGHLYFVMEYIDGTNLREILRGPGLKSEEALLVVSQICDALYSAHQQGVVHRDIKPENVLITHDGYVKLADFGLARPAQEDGDNLTGANVVLGTDAYMAPEQRAGQADGRSDIYALGVMLYEMLTGKRPQGAFTAPSVSVQVDVRLDQVVIKALQQEPERRYQAVSEFKKDVDSIRSTPMEKAGASRWNLSELWRKQPVALAVLVLALLVAAVYFQWPKGQQKMSAQKPPSEDLPGPALPAPIPTTPLVIQAATPPPVVPAITQPVLPASIPLPQLSRAPAATPSATPKPATEVEKWFAQVDGPQQETFRKEVLKPFEAGMADLRARYLATLDAALARASAADELTEALAWRTERQAFMQAHNVAADDDGTPGIVRTVRAAFRQQLARLDQERSVPARALFAQYDAILAKNQSLLTQHARLDDALLLKERRNAIALAWLGPSSIITVGAADRPESAPPITIQTTPAPIWDAPVVNSLGMKFLQVPITGGPTAGHRVLFSVWDVRVQDYEVFVKETKRRWIKPDFSQGPTHPAVNVSWEDARAFCAWLTERERKVGNLGVRDVYRLPSDHEWSCAVGIGAQEDAAKLPSEMTAKISDIFPWGSQWPPPETAGNYASEELAPFMAEGKYPYVKDIIHGYHDGYTNTSPVGRFTANRFGLFDMGGNVWQWCEDSFDNDPQHRVLRGASWDNSDRGHLLSSSRNLSLATSFGGFVGIRCVLELAPLNAPASSQAASPISPEAPGESLLPSATKSAPFVNSLGMKFMPVPITGGPTDGQRVLFSVWDTRMKDYEVFVQDTKREWRKTDFAPGPMYPVILVTWEDATAFCAWLTERERKRGHLGVYRLPSDHEWSCAVGLGTREDAAKPPSEKRGKIDDAFPWGTQWPPPDRSGNFASEELLPFQAKRHFTYAQNVIPGYHDGYAAPSPVGTYPANAFGLYDMGGNVWQWCEDWFDQDQKARVARGSCWFGAIRAALLSSSRMSESPIAYGPSIGFRCVLDISER